MIRTADEVTSDLVNWVASVLPDVEVCVHSLGAKERKQGVDLRLLRVNPRPRLHTPEPSLVADLDYLISIQLADPAAEQRGIAELTIAAMQRWDLEVLRGRDVFHLCATLGIAPAPGFVLRAPLTREREVKQMPFVRAPLVVHTSDMGVIAGQVLGPQDIPIAGAMVAIVGLDRSARTDRHGRFQIAAVPSEGPVRIIAQARGAEIEGLAASGQPITLHLPLEV
jgi:hypothetical protein